MHLATALGVQAIEHHRERVRFFSTVEFATALEQEKLQGKPGRIAARLSASQDLLIRSAWQGIDIHELIGAQLRHFKHLIGSRIFAGGRRLTHLTSASAQAVGMALHELATNAANWRAS
jgi:two-component sensor histidine kinase